MKNITKLLAVALPLAAGLYSGTASAATEVFAAGALVAGGNGPVYEVETAAFDDAYTFNFNFGPAASGANLDVRYADLLIAGHTFSSLTGALWQDNGALGVDAGDVFLRSLTGGDAPNIFNGLANGNYYFNIAGVPDPLGGTGSTFAMHIDVTPVPEPETYAMKMCIRDSYQAWLGVLLVSF